MSIQLPLKELNLSPVDLTAPSTPSAIVYKVSSVITHSFFFLTLPIFIPYITIKHILLGPPCSWMTLKSNITSRLIKHYLSITATLFLPPIDPKEWQIAKPFGNGGRKGVKIEIVTLQPVGDELRKGIANCDNIMTTKRPGFWVTPDESVGKGNEPAGDLEKVILYLHGGAYIIGHPVQTPFSPSMAKLTKLRVLGVNYRKPVTASQAFPAALLDALAGYIHLTSTLNFKPQNIIFLGDSAGGHLCLMLSRYLTTISLPQPGYFLLSSPWVDFTHSFPSIDLNFKYDYLTRLSTLVIPSALRYYKKDEKAGLYFSPALGKPEDFVYLKESGPKVYIQVGMKELLCDEILAFAETLKQAGVDVTLRKEDEGLHCGAVTRFEGSNAWDTWKKEVVDQLS